MDRKLHFLESFSVSGSDGATYKVCGYEHLVRDESLPGGIDNWESTGEIEYRLADGRQVEARRDGSMRVAGTDVQLERIKEDTSA